MDLLFGGASLAVFLYILLLLARVLLGVIMRFSPNWRPRGIVLVATEMCFSATDPPLRFLRGILPAVHLGGARFDLALPVLFLSCYGVLYALAYARSG